MTHTLIVELAGLLSRWDRLPSERSKTGQVATKAFGPNGLRSCAICGSAQRSVEVAHVKSLAEGGITDNDGLNLIPLCHGVNLSSEIRRILSALNMALGRKDSEKILLGEAIDRYGRGSHSIGCHELYDHALISQRVIQDIRATRNAWGTFGEVRQRALDTSIRVLGPEYDPGTDRHWKMLEARLNLKGFSAKTYHDVETAEERNNLLDDLCKCISVHRRTSSQKDFRVAEAKARIAEQLLLSKQDPVLARKADILWYELALVEMARRPQPNLVTARRLLRRSCRAARAASKQAGWAMSALEWVHTATRGASRITDRQFVRLRSIQDHCVPLLTADAKTGSVDMVRWPMNALMHRARLCLRAGKPQEAIEASRKAWEDRSERNLASGRRQIQGVHWLAIDAVAAAHLGQPGEVLRLSARALAIMRAARGKRPEGFKDLALCVVWALTRLNEPTAAAVATRLAASMVDGRSDFWTEPLNS